MSIFRNLLDHIEVTLLRSRIRRKFKRYTGYTPNLDNPQSYCEKIQWLKLNHLADDPFAINSADKLLVKDYVREKGYADSIVELYGAYDQPEDITWEELPQRFVLKLNNASGTRSRWFVKDKSSFNISKFESQAKKRMFKKHGWRHGEAHYHKISPKIIAEEYLEDAQGSFKDYSFYCFHGKVVFISVEEGCTEGETAIEYYNRDWEKHPVDFGNDFPRSKIPYEKPKQLELMIEMAEVLSNNYPHLRVDMYYVNNHIYFGELTFAPENGFIEWRPVSLDFEYGKLIDLTKLTEHS